MTIPEQPSLPAATPSANEETSTSGGPAATPSDPARCEVCGRVKWEFAGPARKLGNCTTDYDWATGDDMAECFKRGYERLLSALNTHDWLTRQLADPVTRAAFLKEYATDEAVLERTEAAGARIRAEAFEEAWAAAMHAMASETYASQRRVSKAIRALAATSAPQDNPKGEISQEKK